MTTPFEVREVNGETVLRVRGSWRLPELNALFTSTLEPPPRQSGAVVVDGSELEELDTAGAWLVYEVARRWGADADAVALRDFRPAHEQIAELVRARLRGGASAPPPSRSRLLARFGRSALIVLSHLESSAGILGSLVVFGTSTALRPWRFRTKEFAVHLGRATVDSLFIVALVMLLVGIVFAYVFAAQLENYGARVFIVDAVSFAMCRELSPVIIAIVMAGRSGSAFTAEIGAMKLRDEIAAMTTMGVSPIEVLVLPRAFALVLAMPLLVFFGDVVSVLGGMSIADSYLGIPPSSFIERLRSIELLDQIVAGLVKAPVFALAIAVIGCSMGLTVENQARSVGLHTTSAVVQSIVTIVVLDSGFAFLFQSLGI